MPWEPCSTFVNDYCWTSALANLAAQPSYLLFGVGLLAAFKTTNSLFLLDPAQFTLGYEPAFASYSA